MHTRLFAGMLLLWAFGLSSDSAAAIDTIKGTVLDSSTNNPVQGVTVRSEGMTTQTDASGVFNLVLAGTGVKSVAPRTFIWDPGKQSFSWKGNQKGVSLEVRNLSGVLVARANTSESSSRFSIARLPQGVYVVTLHTPTVSEVFKIAKVRTNALVASTIVASLDGAAISTLAAAADTTPHVVVFRKTGYNVVIFTLTPNPPGSGPTIKILKSDFDSPFDPSAVPNIQPLFDGRTMTGWNYNTNGWSVQRGCIMGNPASGGQFCASKGLYQDFRWFATQIQISGNGGHTGMGVAGLIPNGNWDNLVLKFHDLMTPSYYFWDYYINSGDDGGTTKHVDMTAAPYNLKWQGSWYQVEMLVSISKGTIRAAMNGVDFLTHKFTQRNGIKPSPVGLQSHGGNGEVRYKDLWIEVNPKDTTLLSVKK